MSGRREPRGATEYTGANAKYMQVAYGCLCEVSKTPIEGWVNPVNQKTGEVIREKWVKVYKDLEAWVNKLEWYSHQYGENKYLGWKLHMEAGGVNYVLDLPLNGIATQKFMFSARNIDFNVPLSIAAWTDNSGDLAVWLKQDDQTVYQFYKKGDMKNCPEPIQREGVGGKVIWDWTETEKFLWDEMQNVIAPAIAQAASLRTPAQPSAPAYSGQEDYGYTGQPSAPAAAPATQAAPFDPIARSLGDMVTAKQLGMIRAIAKNLDMDADGECSRFLQCRVEELSKRAASDFINHLQAMKVPAYSASQSAAYAPSYPVTGPAPPAPAQLPIATPAQMPAPVGAATHGAECSCSNCNIPF